MIQIDTRSSVPIYEQLTTKISDMVAAGVLMPDESLPSVRALAVGLGINPNTVQKAYSALLGEGIIYQIPGRGSFVSASPEVKKVILKKHIDGLKLDLQKARAAGVSLEAAMEALKSVFEEGNND